MPFAKLHEILEKNNRATFGENWREWYHREKKYYKEENWTKQPEWCSPPEVTLIIALRAVSGEIVVAADCRTSMKNAEGDGRIIIDDTSPKLIDFDGAIVGVAGNNYGVALNVVKKFVVADKRDSESPERLSKALVAAFAEQLPERKDWPRNRVMYCDYYNEQSRILHLRSAENFAVSDEDCRLQLVGSPDAAAAINGLFGVGRTVEHAERFCLLSQAVTKEYDPSVGGSVELWILTPDGIRKRAMAEMLERGAQINNTIASMRRLMYPDDTDE